MRIVKQNVSTQIKPMIRRALLRMRQKSVNLGSLPYCVIVPSVPNATCYIITASMFSTRERLWIFHIQVKDYSSILCPRFLSNLSVLSLIVLLYRRKGKYNQKFCFHSVHYFRCLEKLYAFLLENANILSLSFVECQEGQNDRIDVCVKCVL